MIGQAINRVDGPLKVTGQATYAYEHWEAGQPLYGFILGATIGRGRITGIDTSRAEQSPGVRLVMTYRNAPPQGAPDESVPSLYWRAQPVLTSPEIRHYGQPVALVVAATFEQARAAANLDRRRIRRRAGTLRFRRTPGPGVCSETGQCVSGRPTPRWAISIPPSTPPRSKSIRPTPRRISSPSRWSRTTVWRCRTAMTSPSTSAPRSSMPPAPRSPARSASTRSGFWSSPPTSAGASDPSSASIPKPSSRRSPPAV